MGIFQEAKNQLFDRASAAIFKDYSVGSVHTADGQIGGVVRSSVMRGEIVLDIRGEHVIYRGRHIADLDTFISELPGPLGKPVSSSVKERITG